MTTRTLDTRPAFQDLDADVARATRLAEALVATPSVNPELEKGGAGEAEIAALTAGWLEHWGFEVTVEEAASGRPNVVARLSRGRGRRLVLNGHLDTVGVSGMTVPPFEPVVRGGRLYGRGACDMKAGVAALLAAARDVARGSGTGGVSAAPNGDHGAPSYPGSESASHPGSDARSHSTSDAASHPGSGPGSHARSGPTFRRANPAFHGELIVALTADEEHASLGMQALVDGVLDADGAVVCEPTGLAVMPAHKGFVWIEVDFHGRAAHGSRPERGVDAIRHAARFLTALDGLDAELTARSAHPLLGAGTLHAGTIVGGSAPSVYPAECRLVLERRTLPGETAEAVLAEVDGVLERVRTEAPTLEATARLGLVRPGTEVSADTPVVRALHVALADERQPPRVEGMTAWVDAALLNEAGTPAVCFGPGSIDHAHAADESVPVAEIEVAHAVLRRFVQRFLSG